jgi:hypothetical protein
MVSIRTHFPSVPKNGQSLSSRRRSSLSGQIGGCDGSSLSGPTCSGFIWWGLREIPNGGVMIIIMYWSLSVINTVFQTWWSMIIYIHLLCFFKSMNWEEAVRGGGPFLKFWWGESTLESNTSHGDVYIGKFFGHLWTVSSYLQLHLGSQVGSPHENQVHQVVDFLSRSWGRLQAL